MFNLIQAYSSKEVAWPLIVNFFKHILGHPMHEGDFIISYDLIATVLACDSWGFLFGSLGITVCEC